MSSLTTSLIQIITDIIAYVGPVGAVLLLMSVFSIMLIFLKMLSMASFRLNQARQLELAMSSFDPAQLDTFTQMLQKNSHPAANLMLLGARLHAEQKSTGVISSAIQSSALALFAKLSRHNRLLELIGLIAPLLGLLGTILGMITAFQALQESGQQADPTVLAGGIWEALLTTAIGLIVAIPAIVAYNLIENRMEALREQTISLVGQFLAGLEGPR